MIKANELRIGNQLRKDRIIVTIDARSIFDIWESSDKYSPIPLTESQLLQFGFEKILGAVYVKDRVEISYYYKGYFYLISTGLKIDTVHHLQNLYYFSTGKELKSPG